MDSFSLPFLTREMLKFEQSTRFAIVVQSASTRATTITITGATRSGPFKLRHTCVATEVPQSETFNLPDIPIWISAKADALDVAYGEIYIQISFALNNDIMQPLAGGYVYGFKAISWPQPNVEPPIPDNTGATTQKSVTQPAAGSNFTYTIGTYTHAVIKAVTFTLTTSATVANRRVHLMVYDAGAGNMDFHASVDQAASLTRNYTCVPLSTAGSYADDNDIIIPISPDIIIGAQGTIQSAVLNLQAGDQLSIIKVAMVDRRSTLFF